MVVPLLCVNVPALCVKMVDELCEPPILKFPVGAVKSPCNKENFVSDNAVVPISGVSAPAVLLTIKCAVLGAAGSTS